ncbi:MAG TPA: 16S rRNA (uracil(1498)-N(3))-methyltransferase [Lachnospiraceae bacterium]|nr:16S rRNA (uracil(1498)-N(3))-methyltransferase [Lachnospiraceae bacterium]
MHNFFVEPWQIQGNEVRITGNDVNHIKNVLRMKPGDELSVSNGMDNKEYRCGIEEFADDAVCCRLRFIKEADVELPSKVYLFQGLPKGDKMELIIQKAVELGVYEIIPVAAKRAVVKLDEKKAKNKIIRWQGISQAAAKQSRRRIIPMVKPIMSMKEATAYAKKMDVRLIPYEMAEGMAKTREIMESLKPGQSVAVFIGPEGGFEESEVEMAKEAGICPITMGKRILRTETAGFTMMAWIVYQLEEDGI